MARAKATGSKLMTTLPVVGDFMDTRVHTVSPDTDIFDAVESFLKNHVTGAPVVDDAGKFVGILSISDLVETPIDSSDTGKSPTPLAHGEDRPEYLAPLCKNADTPYRLSRRRHYPHSAHNHRA